MQRYRLKAEPTLLDQLTDEILTSSTNDVKEKLEQKVFALLSEDSIIERTKDCKSYFSNYVSAQAMINKDSDVRCKMLCRQCVRTVFPVVSVLLILCQSDFRTLKID